MSTQYCGCDPEADYLCERHRPNQRMQFVDGVWMWRDEAGDLWKLTPTGDMDMPLRIEILSRNNHL